MTSSFSTDSSDAPASLASGSQSSFNSMTLFDQVTPIKPQTNHSIVSWASPILDKYSDLLIERSKLVIPVLCQYLSLTLTISTRSHYFSDTSLNHLKKQQYQGKTPKFLEPYTCPKTNCKILQKLWEGYHAGFIDQLLSSLIKSKDDEAKKLLAFIQPGGSIAVDFMKV